MSRRPKVVLAPEPADELVLLLTDAPGHADEALLDDAKQALESGFEHIPGDTQKQVRSGMLIALQLDADEVEAALVLIEDNRVAEPRAISRLASRLGSRVQKAAKRRNRH